MPTYEYACSSCRRRFDVVQSFTDEALTVCEECGGALKRVYHPVGVVLKGSGFYATDNRSKGALAPKGEAATEKAEKKASSSSDSSSSSAPAAPKEPSSPPSSKPAKKDP